jgi:PAS domain-containing protein
MTNAAIIERTATVVRPAAHAPARIGARPWADATAHAAASLLQWAEAGGDALLAVDAAGRVVLANYAFGRLFAIGRWSGGAVPAPIERFVPLLSAARLARWLDETGAGRGTHRLLAECVAADGERFLAAVTLVRVPDAGTRDGERDGAPACTIALRPLDAALGRRIAGQSATRPGADSVPLGALVDAALRAQPDPAVRRRFGLALHAVQLRITVDPDATRDALARLLDNACRHSPPDVPVQVRSRSEPADPAEGADATDRVVITVADRGPGLSRARAQRVFDPFRAPEPAGGSRDAGLGLAVARHLVESQGGWIELRSELGVGTEVEVWLPALPVRPACGDA